LFRSCSAPNYIPDEQPWEFHSAKKHENIVELNTVHKRRIIGFIRSVLLTAGIGKQSNIHSFNRLEKYLFIIHEGISSK